LYFVRELFHIYFCYICID